LAIRISPAISISMPGWRSRSRPSRGIRNKAAKAGGALTRTEPERAPPAAAGEGAQSEDFGLEPLDPFGHLLAVGGQHPAARQPVEQADGEALLEVRDTARHGAVVDPEAPRRRRQAAGSRELGEIAQIVPVEAEDRAPPGSDVACHVRLVSQARVQGKELRSRPRATFVSCSADRPAREGAIGGE
jgi:hypothetical protein